MRPLSFTLLLLLPLLSEAQIGRKELRTDTGTIVLHFFKNGGVSTKEWTGKDGRWGRSWAYAGDGRELTSQQTRKVGGHASLRFSYHPNGAVSRAEYSEAPDAGVQWYKSTTTFDEAGERTGFSEHGRDNYGPLPRIHLEPAPSVPQEKPFKQEVVREQRMFVNEVFAVNPTRSACRVIATPKDPSPAMPGGTYTMAPGDTIRIGTYSMGETFPPWQDHLTLGIQEVVLKQKHLTTARVRTDEVQVDPEHRRYYVVIEEWAKAGKEKEAGAKPKKRRLFW